LALYQNATQSSTYSEGLKTGEASLAVDGDRRKDWNQGFCTHTNSQKEPWWRVDLGASLPVAEIVIVNRLCTSSSPCPNYMNAFEIRIGSDTSYSTYTSCGRNLFLDDGETKSFYCDPPAVGRYVSVVIPGNAKFINICEVEVYSVRQVSSGVTGDYRFI